MSAAGPAWIAPYRLLATKDIPLTQFSDLGLAAPLLDALAAESYTEPTPIQAQAIPHVLAGRDLLGIAQTGTGKTAAFALPILHRLAADRRPAHAAQLPGSGPGADARAGQPDRGELRDLRPQPAADLDRRLRRRRHAPPGADHGARRRHPGRHAGPAGRPHEPAHRSGSTGSRWWCWTRSTACSTSASSTPSGG